MRPRVCWLTTDKLAERWKGRVTKETLRNWRHQGRGPPYHKMGDGPKPRILYTLQDVLDYEAAGKLPPKREILCDTQSRNYKSRQPS